MIFLFHFEYLYRLVLVLGNMQQLFYYFLVGYKYQTSEFLCQQKRIIDGIYDIYICIENYLLFINRKIYPVICVKYST